MQHRATIRYTEDIVKAGVRGVMRKTFGGWTLVFDAILIVCVVWFWELGLRTWPMGVMATGALLSLVIPIVTYFVLLHGAMAGFRLMGNPVAEIVVDEEVVAVTSDLGTSSSKWKVIAGVWRFESLWLLQLAKSHFVTLPLSDISPDMQAFMLDRIREAGGKIK